MDGNCEVIEVASKSKKKCQFPFVFKNHTYYGCTKKASLNGKAWCSTRTNPTSNEHITGQKLYGDCDSSCPMNECQVTEKASNQQKPCEFPFIFKKVTYHGCTKDDAGENGNPWCSTKVNSTTKEHITGQSFFGDCNPSCPINKRNPDSIDDSVEPPKVNCMVYCDKTLRPVCGSNGKTYPNKCVFDGAKCKDNSIELAYEGLCLTPKIEKKCNKLKALGKCTQEKVLLGCKTICDKAKSNSVNPDDVEKNQDENESTETKELSSQESLGKALLLSE